MPLTLLCGVAKGLSSSSEGRFCDYQFTSFRGYVLRLAALRYIALGTGILRQRGVI